MSYVLVVAGLAILVVAGDLLVRGAVTLSLRLGIPALIVSLTVVAFGTSSPEMVIGVSAVLSGTPGIAIGNVVGSNTANILLVLGVPALIYPILLRDRASTVSYVEMLGASLIFIVMCFLPPIETWQGLMLLALLAVILWHQAVTARRTEVPSPDDLEGAEPGAPVWKIAAFLVIGIGGLPIGAQLLITGAEDLARSFGLSDAVIGLTLVAIGTSLPELATTIAAAFRREPEVAVGNVIGSNLFNILAIIGVASLFGDIPVDEEFRRLDLWVMLGASLILAPFIVMGWSLGRLWGAAFLVAYGVYLWQVVAS